MSRTNHLAALLTVTALAVGATGCQYKSSQACCPTDARSIVLACAGEEAVRKGPCGPDASYAGYHPTSWNYWPEGWDGYGQGRCNTCPQVEGPGQSCETCETDGAPTPVMAAPVEANRPHKVYAEPVVGAPAEPVSVLEATPLPPSNRADADRSEIDEAPTEVLPSLPARRRDEPAAVEPIAPPTFPSSEPEIPSGEPPAEAQRTPYQSFAPPAAAVTPPAEPTIVPVEQTAPRDAMPAAASGTGALFGPPPKRVEPERNALVGADAAPAERRSLFAPPRVAAEDEPAAVR